MISMRERESLNSSGNNNSKTWKVGALEGMELMILAVAVSVQRRRVEKRERERVRTVKGDAIETSFQLQCHLSVAVGVL